MSMFDGACNGNKDYYYEEMSRMFEELSLEDITDIFHWILKYKKLEEKEDYPMKENTADEIGTRKYNIMINKKYLVDFEEIDGEVEDD